MCQNTFPASGNVGIGTTTPQVLLDVAGTISVGNTTWDRGFSGLSIITHNLNLYAPSGASNVEYSGSIKPYVDSSGYGGLSLNSQTTQWGGTFGADTYAPSITASYPTITLATAGITRVVVNNSGNVGIGTASPQKKLDVAGDVNVAGSLYFADGSVQATAWNGVLSGGDYAESINVTGPRQAYEPGDVLVVDPKNPGHYVKAIEPYSTAVAGIYSTKPGLIGRRQTTDPKKSTSEIPMAMLGIVPTKVSAENGPIKPGDVLVTFNSWACNEGHRSHAIWGSNHWEGSRHIGKDYRCHRGSGFSPVKRP